LNANFHIFIILTIGLAEHFTAELLRLMPEKFTSSDVSHLPAQYVSGLGRYANRRRNFGLGEGQVNYEKENK
jgi:hypothetical protein